MKHILIKPIDFHTEIDCIALSERLEVQVSSTAKKCICVFLTDVLFRSTLAKAGTSPIQMLPRDLQGLAREIELEHQELAFDTTRVQELLVECGGNPVDCLQLACVLHLYCTRLLQGANRHRIKAARNQTSTLHSESDSSLDMSEDSDAELARDPRLEGTGARQGGGGSIHSIRVSNLVGARSDRTLRMMMKRAVEFSGLLTISIPPAPNEDVSLQKPYQYHYRWPLSFVVRNLRRDWGESSDESSDGMLGPSFSCCNKKGEPCRCVIG